ncbi:hypothetical protein P7C70_g2753, partial [Phenoliferia sp. Uapishka_3]
MLPIIDLDAYLASPISAAGQTQAAACVEALVTYGAFVLRDSRVSEHANDCFLDCMEDYFAQHEEELVKDTRPQYHYQVGATLENTEKPKCHSDDDCRAVIASLSPEERPLDLEGGKADPKCRFFHRMGISPPTTAFPSLGKENVTPAAFAANWASNMEDWGVQIKYAVEDVARMLGDGLGVGDALVEAGKYGPHLLAPTATDLVKYGQVGERYHEVVCTPGTVAAMESRKANPSTADRPQIRISSTFFWHLSSDYSMDPARFSKNVDPSLLAMSRDESFAPPMLVGTHVQTELGLISLLA